MDRELQVLYSKSRDARCNQKRESCSIVNTVMEPPGPQNGSAAVNTASTQAQEATCPRQEGGTGECAASEDVEEGSCASDRSVKEPLNLQGGSATMNVEERTLRRYLAPVEWIRSHPVLTLVLTLLLALVVSLAVPLAAVSGRRHGKDPVTPVTPDPRRLLACPHDWVGYHGICYFLSRDRLAWDQAKARCSELRASLAVLKDEEMEFLFHHGGNVDSWLGLRTQDQRLQWVDGSSFNSSVEMKGNAECVHLAENYLGRQPCANDMHYICSRPQTRL